MIDHHADLKKYVPAADEKAVAAIIKHLGIALKGEDTSLVACSSKDELTRVRESWCKKKLALAHSDADLDKAIKSVCETMKGDKNKSRVAFYYLLADHYGKLGSL
jgi:phage host-nuclease inhibitor protein Gam